MAKILICEDIESSARRLVLEADKDDYETVVLARNFDSDYIINNISRVVLEENPDYMIIDGLNGKFVEAIQLAKDVKTDLVAILYTGSRTFVESFRQMGLPAYHKKSSQELDNMFMYIVDCERAKRGKK